MISRRTLAALALASVAHIASAHDCGAETAWSCQSLADAIPSCPRSCFNQETFGCELDDWDCRCTYKNSMFEETANCVSMDCTESVEEAQQAFEDLCACVASNGNPSASCSSPSSSAPVVVSSASPSSSAPPSFVSSVVSASVTPSSSLPPSFVPISSFPVFSSSAAISSAVSSSAPISSAPSSVISSASSALPSSASCTDDSESCIPPASTLATFLDYPASSPAVVTSSGKPTSTPSAAYPFTNSSTISYVVKPTGYPVDGGYPTPSKSVGGYAPGLYPNSTTIKTVYPQATTTCTDDKSVPTGAPYPGSDKPGNGNNGGEYKPAPVEEKPYEGVPSAPKPEYPGSGSGSGSESGSGSYPGSGSDSGSYPGSSSGSSSDSYPGSGSDSYPGSGSDSGSGSYPGSGSDSASYPGSGSGSGSGSDSGSYPGSGSGSAYQPVASTSVSAVSPVGQDDSYVVTAGVARGSELATGGVAFAAFIVGLGLL